MPKQSNLTKEKEPTIPPNVLYALNRYLGISNETDVLVPKMRDSFANVYPMVFIFYGVLILAGLVLNTFMFYHAYRNKLYKKNPTYSFLMNNAISDLIKCLVVLPMSLYIIMVQNWLLGEVLCSFIPMMQDLPIHTTTLTFMLIAWDRLRYVRRPLKPRLPGLVCNIGTWLTSFILVLPFPLYIIYLDLGKYFPMYEGLGLCIVNLIDNIEEYMRGMFLTMYAGPMAIISYLNIKVTRELETYDVSLGDMFDFRGERERSRTDSHSTATDFRSSRFEFDRGSPLSRSSCRDQDFNRGRLESFENDLDVARERRTQKYLVRMVTAYGLCLCPLMILRLARTSLVETYENSGHFDMVYTIFVWIGFLPTCSTPLLYAGLQMNRASKQRIKGYFRNRKLRQSCETVITAAGTPATPRAKRTHNEQLPFHPTSLSVESCPGNRSSQQEVVFAS